MTDHNGDSARSATDLVNEATSLHQQGQLRKAEQLYLQALIISPRDPDIMHRLGLLLVHAGKPEQAVPQLEHALQIDPNAAQTWLVLAMAQAACGQENEAMKCCRRVLALQADHPAALNLAGNLETNRGNFAESCRLLKRAVSQRPDFADAHHNLAIALVNIGDTAGSLRHYDAALALTPDVAQIHFNRGLLLRNSGNLAGARDAFRAALNLAPGHIAAQLEYLYAKLFLCDWDGFDSEIPALVRNLEKGSQQTSAQMPSPYILNLLPVPAALTRQVTQRYAEQIEADSKKHIQARRTKTKTDARVHIAYLSPDFGEHAVGGLIASLFEQHDHARFRVSGFSLREFSDPVSEQIRRGCDSYHDLSGMPLQTAAETMAEQRPDIIVDLAGYTSAARPELMAARLAPVQVSWLGYLNTFAAPFIDYLIADNEVIPHQDEHLYSEAIARLPGSFLPVSPAQGAAHTPDRSELGLPEVGVVFCSFNNTYKIQADTFSAWMTILRATPDSVLWLYAGKDGIARDNLLRQAQMHSVAPDRLVFAPALPMAEHLARLPCADLFLDTFHYNAGATAVGALCAGLPLLTLRGSRMLGRMGASLNRTLGMDDLICSNSQDYVDTAQRLAREPEVLAQHKKALANALQRTRVFDIAHFTGELENVYGTMWRIHQAGEQPRSFGSIESA